MRLATSPNVETNTYPLEWLEGRLVAQIGGMRYIIDSGSYTFGRDGVVRLLGQDHEVPEDQQGLDADLLSDLIESPVDGVLGIDLLRLYQSFLSPSTGVLRLDTNETVAQSDRIPVSTSMGVSQLQVTTDSGTPIHVFFDVGSRMSYVTPDLVRGCPWIDRITEFDPSIGYFETDIWEMDFGLAGHILKLRVGVMPELLRAQRKHVGLNKGVLGAEILETFDLVLDVPDDWYAFLPGK